MTLNFCRFLVIATIVSLSSPAVGQAADGANRWRQLGPAFHGVTLLAVDPHAPLTVYAGLGPRGLFRSEDGGGSWVRLADFSINALAVDPFHPETLWAGFDQFGRRGLYRSVNRGLTWELVGFEGETIRGTNSRQGSGGIWPDPNRRNTLYVGTAQGVGKTTDGGATWTALSLPFPAGTGGRFIALDIAPSNSDILFAADTSIEEPENRDQVLKSVNGGRDWTNAGMGDRQLRIRVLLIHPSNPQTVFAGSSLGQRFYRTLNGGETWQGTGVSGGLGHNYVHSLALDPANASRVFAASAGGVYVSADLGETFTLTTQLASHAGWVGFVKTAPSGQGRVYAGLTSAGNRGGGVYASDDGGGSWRAADRGISGSGIRQVVSWDGGAHILGSLPPSTTPYGAAFSSNGTGDWRLVGLGTGPNSTPNCLVRDPADPNSVWAGMPNGDLFRSSDRGRTWTRVPTGIGNSIQSLGFSGGLILAGTRSAGVFRSRDNGESWEEAKSGLTDTEGETPAVKVIEVSPALGGAILAGTSAGVYRSTNGGDSWNRIYGGFGGVWGSEDVNAIQTHPANPNVIYVATENGLAKTTGESWRRVFTGVSYDFNSREVKSVTIHPQDPDWVWIGTKGGVFRSVNDGVDWDAVPWGLEPAAAREVAFLEIASVRPRTILAGTGAGVYRYDGGESQLYFPIYQQISGSFIGFAVANYGGSGADLAFEARDAGGGFLQLENNPAASSLEPLNQLGALGTEILGASASDIPAAWVRLTTTQPWLGSFQQWGNFQLTQMDGSVAWTESARRLFFTRVFQGPRAYRGRAAVTLLSLANPHDEAVQVDLRLNTLPVAGAAGGPVSVSRRVTIPPGGVLAGTPEQVLGHAGDVADGVVEVEVVQGPGVVGASMINLPGVQTTIGLNAQTGNPGLEAFSAQLASAPGIETNLRLWNTTAHDRTVQLEAISDEGSLLTAPVTLQLAAGKFLQRDAAQLFDFADAAVGSLRVTASGDGVIGDVIFGDPDRLTYAAALPLQTSPFSQAVFSQVADVDPFFTGLAFFNPGDLPANVRIRVFSAEGVQTGLTTLSIWPGRRRSSLVPELIPATAGQVRGYIVVTSSNPVVGQQLFGTNSLSLLSAVPPTVIR